DHRQDLDRVLPFEPRLARVYANQVRVFLLRELARTILLHNQVAEDAVPVHLLFEIPFDALSDDDRAVPLHFVHGLEGTHLLKGMGSASWQQDECCERECQENEGTNISR